MTQQPHEHYADLQPSIGDRLRISRERRTGLDQAAFAELIGVSRGTVSNYERDRLPGGPRQRLVLNAWAAACKVTREWLETGKEEEGGTPPNGGGGATLRTLVMGAYGPESRYRELSLL